VRSESDGWYSKSEAASVMGVSVATVERMAQRGELQRRYVPRVGKRPEVQYSAADVDARQPRAAAAHVVQDAPGAMVPAAAVAGGGGPGSVGELLAAVLAVMETRSLGAGMLPPAPLWVDLEEASRITGLSLRWLREAVQVGQLRAERGGRGGRVMVRRRDLETL